MCGACLKEQVDVTESIPKKGLVIIQVIISSLGTLVDYSSSSVSRTFRLSLSRPLETKFRAWSFGIKGWASLRSCAR